MTFKEQIELYLDPLPSEWKEKLTTLLCEINSSQQTVDCQDVKDCETLTSLSNFSVNNGQVCITYKDEAGISVNRCFTIQEILNNQLNNIDPDCLTDQTTWNNMTYEERVQLLITSHCECCSSSTTTTTTSE